jgi:hypothetical protein
MVVSYSCLLFFRTTYWGVGLWVKGFVHCYVGGKFETPKSCEIQTIYAIMKEIRAVTGLARCTLFFY